MYSWRWMSWSSRREASMSSRSVSLAAARSSARVLAAEASPICRANMKMTHAATRLPMIIATWRRPMPAIGSADRSGVMRGGASGSGASASPPDGDGSGSASGSFGGRAPRLGIPARVAARS